MRFSTMPDSEIISELCRRIKETRIQLGLSQIELAERAQVGAATIKRVEREWRCSVLSLPPGFPGRGSARS